MRLVSLALLIFGTLEMSAAFAQTPSRKNISEAPGDVIFEKDIAYRQGHDRWLLNIIYPRKVSGKPVPALVLVHGGGWTGGDHYRFTRMGFTLA